MNRHIDFILQNILKTQLKTLYKKYCNQFNLIYFIRRYVTNQGSAHAEELSTTTENDEKKILRFIAFKMKNLFIQ